MDHFVHRFRLAIAHVKLATKQNWPNSSNELFPENELTGKTAENSYFILDQDKNRRDIFRYDLNRKCPTLHFIPPIDERHKPVLKRAGIKVLNNGQICSDQPIHSSKSIGVLKDCLDFCIIHDNFKSITTS
ncbi:hypothetical protein [Acinetobacter sp. BY419]|nr:hypothetical protein [Acinetobacter sp. BY419]